MMKSEQLKREFAEKTFPLDTEELYNSLQRLYRSELIERITALISEHYYSREFLLWFHDNVQIESQEETFLVYNDIRFYTLNEVRDFWQRVQEKKEYIKRKENER